MMTIDRIYEVDSEGYLHEEESEDVMDLDHTEVLNFLDVNHSVLPDNEEVDFESYFHNLLDRIDEIEDERINAILDEVE